MKSSRIFIALAATALLMSACGKKDQQAAETAQNPLLAHVPTEAPYVFANLEPTPPEVVDAYLARFAPSLEMAQTLLDDLRIEINEDASGEHAEARLVAAILNEVDGKLNREGLESLGFSLETHKVIYGMGAFPVIRIALKNADSLRAAIGRIEARSGWTFPVHQSGDAEYWRIGSEHAEAAMYLAIVGNHAAMGMMPVSAEAELLPALLGKSTPATPMGSEVLAELNRDKGFSNFGSGFVDLRRLADEFLDGNSLTMQHIQAMGGSNPAALDPVCVAEIKGMTAHAPRFVVGTTELTADSIAIRHQLELDKTLAGELAQLVADVAPVNETTDAMMAMSLSLNMGRVREFMLQKFTEMAAAPYQCALLADLNESANKGLTSMNQPMPPFIGNLKGFRVELDEIDVENPGADNIKGLFSLAIEKPQMLIGMAQMFVPGINELGLEPGADPVQLPEELFSVAADGMHVYAMMGKDTIGLAVGEEQQAELGEFMKTATDDSGTFFSLSYDMAAHLDFQRRMQSHFGEMTVAGDSQAEQFIDMARQVQDAYLEMLGRARMDFRFTPAGVEIENRMTFN